MFKRVLIMLFLIFKAYKIFAAYKYSAALQDEEIFVPCNRSGVYFSDRYINMSDIKFEFLANGSIHAYGSVIIIRGPGTNQDWVSLEVFKKDRDRWSPTIYNINRSDACKALFSPTEIWHQYTKLISKENRKCPFFVGQNLTFDAIADLDIVLPYPNLAGNYMALYTVYFSALDEYFCSNIYGEIYRS